MEVTNPLDQLRPNHLPDPVGLWPPAPGWWVLAAFVIVLLVLIAGFAWRRWQKNRYRTLALHLASQRFADYQDHQSLHRLAHEFNELLKRVALQTFPKQQVAGLTGIDWSQFLADTGDLPGFLEQRAFNNDRYNPESPLAPDTVSSDEMAKQLYKLTRRWIKRHHA